MPVVYYFVPCVNPSLELMHRRDRIALVPELEQPLTVPWPAKGQGDAALRGKMMSSSSVSVMSRTHLHDH